MKLFFTLGLLVAASPALAGINLITNGDFETGTYAGWNANVETGSSGGLSILQYGNNAPRSGFPTPLNAAGGTFYSITDQNGPGSYSLTQSFTLATAGTVTFSYDMFVDNQSGQAVINGRDYHTFPNQNATVDLLTGTADPFSNAAGDIVSVLYAPAAPLDNAWIHYSTTLSLVAGTYQLRFAETDNQGFFQQGVDNVVVSATSVAEPGALALMLVGVAGIAARTRRSAR